MIKSERMPHVLITKTAHIEYNQVVTVAVEVLIASAVTSGQLPEISEYKMAGHAVSRVVELTVELDNEIKASLMIH